MQRAISGWILGPDVGIGFEDSVDQMRRPKVELDNLMAFLSIAEKHSIDDAASEIGLSASGTQAARHDIHAGFGILPILSPGLLIRAVYEEPLVAYIPAEHRLAARPAISPQDFDGEPLEGLDGISLAGSALRCTPQALLGRAL